MPLLEGETLCRHRADHTAEFRLSPLSLPLPTPAMDYGTTQPNHPLPPSKGAEEASRILSEMVGSASARAADLLPLVYEELRRLARYRMSIQPPGQTLQATALVHEAYMRVVKSGNETWDGKGHFFAAAAESMRRIVIDNLRKKSAAKRGAGAEHVDYEDLPIATLADDEQTMAVHEALDGLERVDSESADLVKLRYFVGLTLPEVSDALGISERTAKRRWAYARAWLYEQMSDGESRRGDKE